MLEMDDLTELRAALADAGKLDVLTAQAEAWMTASPEERVAILADVRQRGHVDRLIDGLRAAQHFHEWSAQLFRDVLQQIERR
ncbi:hypothetical protein [Mesorhizobium sp. WSM3879]|uniref:hypothetical protein n=1 Tax=Mesorhizobium sp. WSM3879 TaxID=2029406 RepID=UPI00117D12D7|nr:hypothetical protein [Mesorhizobium sp. WSM3879]